MVRAHPIARYLTRFDAGEVEPALFLMPEPVVDAAEIAAAARQAVYAEGFAAGLAAGREETEAACRTADEAAEARLAAEREAWVADEAERIVAALAQGFGAMTDEIADCVEQVLRPFLAGAMREKALADLRGTLARLGETAPLLRITGPDDLVAALRAGVTASAEWVELTPGAAVDVTVSAQPTVIETRLGAWSRRLGVAEEQPAGV